MTSEGYMKPGLECEAVEPLTDAMIQGWIYNGHDAEASAIARLALYGKVDPEHPCFEVTRGLTQEAARAVVAEMQTEARAARDERPLIRVVP